MDLTAEIIEIPTEEEDKENKVNKTIIDDYEIPVLRIRPFATGVNFEEALRNKTLSVDSFINRICGISKGKKVLKDEVLAMIDYTEITRDEIDLKKEKPKTTRLTITLSEANIARWTLDFIEQTGSFIGNNSYNKVRALIKKIIDAGIQVDTAYTIDYRRALKALERSIIEFYNQKAFELMFESRFIFRKINVKDFFVDRKVTIRKREGKLLNLIHADQEMSSHLQRKGTIVQDYKFSIRPYVRFDSPPEKWVADALEKLCSLDKKRKSFWVRNESKTEYPVEVRPAPFYPDFLAFIRGEWIIVDVKGRHLAEDQQKIPARKKALKLLEKEGGIKTFFLVDDVLERKGFQSLEFKSINDFAGFDELRKKELDLNGFVNSHVSTLFNRKKNKKRRKIKNKLT